MQTSISAIVPCYNQGSFLSAALDSILTQTYDNWECIIVNDGSTDNTATIANKYIVKDSRFKYLYKENGGLSSARNAGLAIATGEYVQFLDADDFIHPDKFQSFVNVLIEQPACKLVLSNFKHYNNKTHEYSAPFCDLSIPITLQTIVCNWDVTFTIPIHCGIIKADIIAPFNETLKAKEDWVMWISLFKKIDTYQFLNKYQAFYRNHGNNMTLELGHMEKNTLLVYTYIYSLIDTVELKDKFFNRCSNYLVNAINKERNLVAIVLNSRSYKIGNFILKPFSLIKRLFKPQ